MKSDYEWAVKDLKLMKMTVHAVRVSGTLVQVLMLLPS